MSGGRPTDYDPAFCARVIDYGKEGKSKAYMASQFDVSRMTIENWMKAHPAFFDAMTRAQAHSQAWWEDVGQSNLGADKFAASVWSRSMAARFPDDWRETSRQEQTGVNGGPIERTDRIELVGVRASGDRTD